jgi:hypothetical protein
MALETNHSDGRTDEYDFPLYIYGSTALVDLGRFFIFLILYTVGRTPWTVDQPVAKPLPTHRSIQI